MTATRMSLFAPATCAHERAEKAALAVTRAELFRNVRRVSEFIFGGDLEFNETQLKTTFRRAEAIAGARDNKRQLN